MKRTRTLLCAAVLASLPLAWMSAAGEGESSEGGEASSHQADAMRAVQDVIRKMDKKSAMENMKRANPKLYQAQSQADDRGRKVREIVAKARTKELSEEEALAKLRPLLRPDLQPQLDALDASIAALQKRLDFMRGVKKDPDLLVRTRVNILLGKDRMDQAYVW